jgi:tetratricopeptide (TPR) repeat protein
MIHDYSNRQLVPRLLSSEISNTLSLNLNTLNINFDEINDFELHNYHKLKTEWELEKNQIIATQLLIYEIIHDSLEINEEAISYLNKKMNQLNQIEKEILNIASLKISNNEIPIQIQQSDENIQNTIKEIKNKNILNPMNSLQWCNLGYYYTRLGLRKKAKKVFSISIGLNNFNRYIVRTVARFFLLIGDIEFGHKILTMSPRIDFDANLISAEIAFSELMGRKNKFIDKGMKLKQDENISILELAYGKTKKGKMLIKECLISPNENSLAQIAFLEKKHLIEPILDNSPSVIFQFEALARSYFAKTDFENALKNAKKWYDFQPFCINPAALSTYIASSILGDFHEAINIAKMALKISPNNFLLQNNLAFSYARNNQVTEAIGAINKINKNEINDFDRAILNATGGFIAFKEGNIDLAKFGYNEAIKYFRLTNDEISLARALYYYSSILDTNEKKSVLNEVEILSKKK